MVKTPDELALMRLSGRMLASVFEMLDRQDLAGMSTLQVNDLVDRFITVDLAARPASKGQYGFKYVLNWSINHVVCHGVPDPDEIIRDGDIVNFDITLEKNGFIADSSKTYLVGNAPPTARRLVRVAREAMWKGIRQVRPGAHLGDIGFAIERHAKRNGYSVVRNIAGMASPARCKRNRGGSISGRPERPEVPRPWSSQSSDGLPGLPKFRTASEDGRSWTDDRKLSDQFSTRRRSRRPGRGPDPGRDEPPMGESKA